MANEGRQGIWQLIFRKPRCRERAAGRGEVAPKAPAFAKGQGAVKVLGRVRYGRHEPESHSVLRWDWNDAFL